MSNKLEMFDKKSDWLLGILAILTAMAISHYYEVGMMGLTVFILAYLSKGMRRIKGRRQEKNEHRLL